MKFAGHEIVPDEEEKFVSGPRLIPAGLEIDIERMLEWYKQVEEANKKNPVWKRITDEKDEY